MATAFASRHSQIPLGGGEWQRRGVRDDGGGDDNITLENHCSRWGPVYTFCYREINNSTALHFHIYPNLFFVLFCFVFVFLFFVFCFLFLLPWSLSWSQGPYFPEALSLPFDFSMSYTVLASNLHICWDTVGCSLCSSEDQLGVPLLHRGKWTPLPSMLPPSCPDCYYCIQKWQMVDINFHFIILLFYWILFLKILFIFSGEGREKQRDRNINVWLPLACPILGTWLATQAGTLTGNRTRDTSFHWLALNPLSHTSQGYWILSMIILIFWIIKGFLFIM